MRRRTISAAAPLLAAGAMLAVLAISSTTQEKKAERGAKTEPLTPAQLAERSLHRRPVKLEFHGSTVTSDAGLLAYRKLDDALGLASTAASGLHDTRTGQNTQHTLAALLRQPIYSRLAGYEDVNDAERLCLDPTLRTVVGGRAKDNTAASTSEMARFETEILSTKENLKHLMDLSGRWIDQAHQRRQLAKLILDMDSLVSETYGHQRAHFGGLGPSFPLLLVGMRALPPPQLRRRSGHRRGRQPSPPSLCARRRPV
jgi:hypothetical protein